MFPNCGRIYLNCDLIKIKDQNLTRFLKANNRS